MHEIAAILGRIDYKPGWQLKFRGWAPHLYIWWEFQAPDCTDERYLGDKTWTSREWVLPLGSVTEDALVKTALAAALQAEEHECREAFTYGGVRLFDPHLPVHKLMEAACHST